MWVAVALAIVLVAFIVGVLGAILSGFWLTVAKGQSAPNFTGGVENLAAIVGAISAAVFQGWQIFSQRHSERRDLIARGSAPIPFPQPAPSSEPSVDGPRPGDSP